MRNIGSGRTAATVVLVGLDSTSMGRVREVLAAEAVLPSSSVSFGDAIASVKRTRPDVVIVSLKQGLDAPLHLAQTLSRELPNVALVALAEGSEGGNSAENILSAMRVGYKEYLVLPDDAARLRQVVQEAAYATDEDEEQGLVVAVVGAKGGVGTTFLATHLAAELSGIHRVIVLDMDFSMGDTASMLDLNPKDSISDLLPRADRIDERMLTGAVAVHRSKIHVLAQPGEVDSSADVRADDIYGIIRAASRGYQFVLIDCGVYLDEATAMSINVADFVLLVTTPSVISVRDAFRRTKVLDQLGVEKDRIRLVVNRNTPRPFVSLSDIAGNLGLKVAGTVADDPKTVETAVNEGKLAREVNRRSEVVRDISSLVGVLTEGGDDEEEAPETMEKEKSSSGFLFGLFGRGS